MEYSKDGLGKMVLFHRKRGGLSRNQLALLAGVGKTAIYDIEHGKVTVQLETMRKILDVLNISIQFDSPLMNKFEEALNEEG